MNKIEHAYAPARASARISLPDIKWQMKMYPVVVAVAANLSKSYYFTQQ